MNASLTQIDDQNNNTFYNSLRRNSKSVTFEKVPKHQRTSTCGSGSTMDEEYNESYLSSSRMDEELSNPQFISNYRKDIFRYILEEQSNYLPDSCFMEQTQKDINQKMRSILIDWIEEVHMKFKLSPNSLYLAINLIDRYLSFNIVKRNKLQLVGVASLFISSKFEEIYPPNIKDFVYVCDRAYTKEEILQMEGFILNTVNFQLNYTSPLRFLEFTVIENTQIEDNKVFQTQQFQLSSYILEIALHSYESLQYLPSQLAQSALLLSNKILGIQSDIEITDESKYCATYLLQLYYNNQNNTLYPAVKRKYAREEHLQVSQITISI
ncbi:unnamed protein product [Paramecium sonneborni]|uniref:Cyclin N-terminal domain-containing protein n=1 Tax=Paramecium sonneborni TaxID=65129 RepID=A0A8S1R1Q8_9CILI|nr:unnamed protein product [Paramecium sonneborni]